MRLSVAFVLLFAAVAVFGQDYPVIPGANIIGMGFDATTMLQKVLPIVDIPAPSPDSQCSPVDECGPTCWQNPIYPDLKYLVPETMCLQNEQESIIVNGSIAISNYTDIQNWYSHTTSHHSFLGFSSKSSTTLKFFGKFYLNDYALNFVYQYHAWYQLSLLPLPPPSLNPTVQKIVDGLPSTYSTDNTTEEWQAHQAFLNRFGTHYTATALMGGKQQSETWFHKCFLSTFNATWVEQQSGWSFLGIITDNKGKINYNSLLNGNFTEYSEATVTYFGGDPYAFNATETDHWVMTIKDNPAPIDYTLEPIYSLVTDSAKQAAMQEAFQDYFKMAGEEMNNYVNNLIPQDPHTKPAWCTD